MTSLLPLGGGQCPPISLGAREAQLGALTACDRSGDHAGYWCRGQDFSSQSLPLIGYGGWGGLEYNHHGVQVRGEANTPHRHIDDMVSHDGQNHEADRAGGVLETCWSCGQGGVQSTVSRDLSAPGHGNSACTGPGAGPILALEMLEEQRGGPCGWNQESQGSGDEGDEGSRVVSMLRLDINLSGRVWGQAGPDLSLERLYQGLPSRLGAGRACHGDPSWGGCRCPGRGGMSAARSWPGMYMTDGGCWTSGPRAALGMPCPPPAHAGLSLEGSPSPAVPTDREGDSPGLPRGGPVAHTAFQKWPEDTAADPRDVLHLQRRKHRATPRQLVHR